VLAVLAFHEQFGALPGGFLGVDIFFVLSGYLITDLLVSQWDRRGTLDLRGFWARRARRLLPPLVVMLVIVTAAAAFLEPGQLDSLRHALIAAVTYSSNWWQALQHRSYFAQFGPPPPLQHLWSLAIEEQFYLIWPLILVVVLLATRSTRIRSAVAWTAAALSALAMTLIYVPGADPSRVYYGTDTHSSALLVGAALAVSLPLQRVRSASRENVRTADAAGFAGIAVLAWAMGHFSGNNSLLYPLGLLIAALAAGGLVIAAASGGAVSWILGWAPLRWVGVRSYAIYLWHWPVIALMAVATGRQRQGFWLSVAETAMAIILAAASWRWIERPILRDGFRATIRARYRVVAHSLATVRRSPAGVFPVLVAVAAVTVACTAGYGVLRAPKTSPGLEQQINQGIKVSQASHASRTGAGGSASTGTAAAGTAAAGTAAAGTAAGASPGSARRGSQAVTGPGAGNTSRAAHGAAAAGAAQAGSGHSQADHARVSGSQVTAIGDSVMLASAGALQATLHGIYIDAVVSRQVSTGLSVVAQLAASGRLRHVVLFALGTNGTFTGAQMHQLLNEIGPQRRLVLVNTYEARPWQNGDNRLIAATARARANVVLANWYATISKRTGLLWPDLVHPRPPGAVLYAHMVAGAVRAALSSSGSGRRAQPGTTTLPHPRSANP
jgi:peptidoglycan/LPS O-acetylase OafA/YrhL